jgi:hypothetical protein
MSVGNNPQCPNVIFGKDEAIPGRASSGKASGGEATSRQKEENGVLNQGSRSSKTQTQEKCVTGIMSSQERLGCRRDGSQMLEQQVGGPKASLARCSPWEPL